MKHTIRFTAMLAVLFGLASCQQDEVVPTHERTIVYTVSGKTTTAHLTTEDEWQALLDRFCDYAKAGSAVTFYNANRVAAKGAKDATSFSTTSREEIKAWMARMEDAGKTVTVSYDPNTGTWSGTAYATAPQPPMPVNGLITYSCDEMSAGFGYIMSFDTVNHRAYVTVHDTRMHVMDRSFDPHHLSGVYEYRHADEVNCPFAYWFITSWGDTAGLYYLEFVGSSTFAGSQTLRYETSPMHNPATFVRTNSVYTYLCSYQGANVDIVLHITGNVANVWPPMYSGQMGFNVDEDILWDFYVWPFGSGRFNMIRTVLEGSEETNTFALSLDFRAYGQDEVIDGFTIQGEPMSDEQFTINKNGESYLFQRL